MITFMNIEILANLLTLTFLEIILGIDNIVFIAICSERLPKLQQARGRKIGLLLALISRLLLLFALFWTTKLTYPLFSALGHVFDIRDLIFIGGGIFLLIKSGQEIHAHVEQDEEVQQSRAPSSFYYVVTQIMIFDIIFSLDSVITAIGISQELWVMSTAIVVAVLVMVFATEWMSRFIKKHPTIKILALSFLLLIGVILIADGFGSHIPRGYIYFAIGFSIFVEFINQIYKRRRKARRMR
jgi:predicted tellurium resistance membrane protein TerC